MGSYAVFLSVCLAALVCGYINGTSCKLWIQYIRKDSDNDGIADRVYYYTYNVAENLISLGIDSDSDGAVNEIYNYNLGRDIENKPLLMD